MVSSAQAVDKFVVVSEGGAGVPGENFVAVVQIVIAWVGVDGGGELV